MARPHTIIAVGAALNKLEELLGADHRTRVTRKEDDRERAEHCVDRAALEAELAQVGTGEECTWRLEELGC
jgi:hypothetical protein